MVMNPLESEKVTSSKQTKVCYTNSVLPLCKNKLIRTTKTKKKKQYSPRNPQRSCQGGPWTFMKRRGVFGTSRVLQGAMCWASDSHVERSQIHNVETWRMFSKLLYLDLPDSVLNGWLFFWSLKTPSLKQHPLEDAGIYIYARLYHRDPN